MNEEYGVKIIYKNKDLKPVDVKCYALKDYTDMFRIDLMRLIADVEDLVYVLNDNKPKDEWPQEVWSAFCRIKHKLLDKAGEIQRLPENLIPPEQNGKSVASYIADVFSGKA